jgi:hypothetical protein
MNLQEMLGDAFHEDMSLDEINTALSGKKYADLSTGNYVDANKYKADLEAKTNELSNVRKQLDAKLSDSEKEAASREADKAKIRELEEFIKNQNVASNRDRVEALTGDVKTILGIESNNEEYGKMLSVLSQNDTDNARSIATYINKLVKESYEKGKKDANKDNLGNFSNGVNTTESNKEPEAGSFGKMLAESGKPEIDPNYYFKRN